MEIARVLWERGEATVRQVHESLPPGREIDFTTAQTYLRRLEAKGYAKAKLVGRTRVYSVKVKPETVIRETVGEIVERLFDGKPLPMVQHLIEEGGIGREEIGQLRQLLDRLEKEEEEEERNGK